MSCVAFTISNWLLSAADVYFIVKNIIRATRDTVGSYRIQHRLVHEFAKHYPSFRAPRFRALGIMFLQQPRNIGCIAIESTEDSDRPVFLRLADRITERDRETEESAPPPEGSVTSR